MSVCLCAHVLYVDLYIKMQNAEFRKRTNRQTNNENQLSRELQRLFESIAAMKLHYGDMTDSTCLVKIIAEVKPTEIYNLAAQSHVKVKLLELQLHHRSLWGDCDLSENWCSWFLWGYSQTQTAK